jgi:hypothetical protein
MANPDAESHRDYWLSQSRRISRRVNFAWCLEKLAAPLLVSALLGAVALLWVRREIPDWETGWFAASLGGLLLLLILVAFFVAARSFENPQQSLVRLEAQLQLNNALSAAHAGVWPWPKPVGKIDAGLRWHWPRLLVPPLGALALLAAGWFIPLPARPPHPVGSQEEPQAWKKLDAELAALTEEKAANEDYLEETRKKLEELRAQENDQWFSHSSLEATDALEKSHRSETGRVEQELERAENALEMLEQNAAGMNAEDHAKLADEFDQALEGLKNGAMKPNPELLKQMDGWNRENLRQISPEQLQQLQENLEKNQQAMKDARQGEGEAEGESLSENPSEVPGNGGVDRGPGHHPDVLGAEKAPLDTGEMKGLEAQDLSRALPGDLLQLQDGEHDLDLSNAPSQAGGDVGSTGAGGDRVWRESLDPSEQRALKRFFE